MPGTVFEVAVLLLLIVPGYLFIRGYTKGSAGVSAQPDLYVLAQSVVVSLFLLAAARVLVGWTMVNWENQGVLFTRHRDYLVVFGVATAIGSLILGTVLGNLSTFFGTRQGRVLGTVAGRLHRWTGAWTPPDLWTEFMAELNSAGEPVLVAITTKGGKTIYGAFDLASSARGAPAARELRLSAVYELAGHQLTRTGRGVYLQGADIESVQILTYT